MKNNIYVKAVKMLSFYSINDIANMLTNNYKDYCKLFNFLDNYCNEI